MSLISIMNSVETAIKAEDISINYFSKLSRKLGRLHPLSLQFERFAKEKVFIKKYFSDLLYIIKNNGLSIIKKEPYIFKTEDFNKFINEIEVVGDHNNITLLLENTLKYQTEVVKFYSDIRNSLNIETNDLNNIIQNNKEFNAVLNQFIDFKSDDYINY